MEYIRPSLLWLDKSPSLPARSGAKGLHSFFSSFAATLAKTTSLWVECVYLIPSSPPLRQNWSNN
jgi:hypothetical protein